jgi:uncharacterized membrane protein YkvA (DUF1232 family)
MTTVEPTSNQPTVPPRSMVGNLVSVIGLVLAGIYLANPTAGIDFIPDLIPGVGNIDEVVATTIFLACLSRLGINVLPQGGPRKTVVQSHVVKD